MVERALKGCYEKVTAFDYIDINGEDSKTDDD
jgi:hypothetical protein